MKGERASRLCVNCLDAKAQPTKTIFHHTVQFSFDQSYDFWINHGEILLGFEDIEQSYEVDSDDEEDNDDIDELLRDAFPTSDDEERNNDEGASVSGRHNNPDVEQLFVDMEKPLFPRCEDFLVLSFILRMMHVKASCKMANMIMDMMLQLLNEAFKYANFPKNHYEAKQYLQLIQCLFF